MVFRYFDHAQNNYENILITEYGYLVITIRRKQWTYIPRLQMKY